jgi:heme a synthase
VRILAGVVLALLMAITVTSAYIRLAQTGLSCSGAPACYAQQATREAANDEAGVTAARLVHRIAASAVGAVIFAMLFVGWNAAAPGERAAMIALVVLAGLLAMLGRYTPSSMPAVVLGNLLGGMTMLALAGWLWFALRRLPRNRSARSLRPWAWAALALVALQIAAGGMIAARHAAFACTSFPDCGGVVWPEGIDLGTFDPWHDIAPPASDSERANSARQAVVLAHRWLAVPTLLLAAWVGARAVRVRVRGPGLVLLVLAVVQGALGAAQVYAGQPLGLAVAHNVGAAGVVLALAALLERTRSP